MVKTITHEVSVETVAQRELQLRIRALLTPRQPRTLVHPGVDPSLEIVEIQVCLRRRVIAVTPDALSRVLSVRSMERLTENLIDAALAA